MHLRATNIFKKEGGGAQLSKAQNLRIDPRVLKMRIQIRVFCLDSNPCLELFLQYLWTRIMNIQGRHDRFNDPFYEGLVYIFILLIVH